MIPIPLFLFTVGAVVGSFLNVCIYRIPRGESVAYPASHCPACNTRLRWPDLIPLLSQVALGGRCRYCRQAISWRYFQVELITGILFVLTGQYSATEIDLVANLILVACLIAVFYIDLDCYIIPDELSLTPAAVGLLADFLKLVFLHATPGHILIPWIGKTTSSFGWQAVQAPVPTSVIGLVVASGVLLLVGWMGSRLFHKESMGGGDVKLAGAIGAYLGFQWDLLTFFLLSIILGAVVGIILMAIKKKSGKDYIPFGPMLVIGAMVTLFWGKVITPVVMNIYTIQMP